MGTIIHLCFKVLDILLTPVIWMLVQIVEGTKDMVKWSFRRIFNKPNDVDRANAAGKEYDTAKKEFKHWTKGNKEKIMEEQGIQEWEKQYDEKFSGIKEKFAKYDQLVEQSLNYKYPRGQRKGR